MNVWLEGVRQRSWPLGEGRFGACEVGCRGGEGRGRRPYLPPLRQPAGLRFCEASGSTRLRTDGFHRVFSLTQSPLKSGRLFQWVWSGSAVK